MSRIIPALLGSAGGGGGGYVAKAVHFDGVTALINPSLSTGAPTTLFSMALFFKVAADFVVPTPNFGGPLFVVDPTDTYQSNAIFYPSNSDNPSQLETAMTDTTFTKFITCFPNEPVVDGTWHSLVQSLDSSGAGRGQLYFDNVLQTVSADAEPLPNFGNCPFDAVFNGLPFYIGGDSFQFLTGDLCNPWIAPNVSLLDGSGVITANTMRKFTTAGNKPSDPANFPPGGILFNGVASDWTSQAAAQGFTLTGSLTNASTSPSD